MQYGNRVKTKKAKPTKAKPTVRAQVILTPEQDAAFVAYLDELGYGSKKGPFLKALLFKAMDEFYKSKEARA